jgi:hypothetical protein
MAMAGEQAEGCSGRSPPAGFARWCPNLKFSEDNIIEDNVIAFSVLLTKFVAFKRSKYSTVEMPSYVMPHLRFERVLFPPHKQTPFTKAVYAWTYALTAPNTHAYHQPCVFQGIMCPYN